MARADSGEGIAQRVGLLGDGVALFAERSNFRLELRRALFQHAEARGSGFKIVSGAVGIVARAHGSFEHVVLGGFELAQRFGLVNERFFGLLLLAVQAKQALAGFGSGAAQRFNARFGFGNLGGAGFGALCEIFHARDEFARFFAQ